MSRALRSLVLLSAWLDIASAANIFVSHYQGTVQSLSLNQNGGRYTLTANGTVTLGGQPSWLTFDSANRILYVADETGYGTASIWSVAANINGGLTQTGKATAPLGSVHNVLYGDGYIASAHYQTSMVTTFKLPLTSSAQTLQKFALTMPGKGTIPSRQDAAHPHEVIVDPTGKFILVPDLGADLIRLYSINASTGMLTSCGQYTEVGGTGPRHGSWWNNSTLYIANELANTVHGFTVTYPASGCIALSRFQSITTMTGNKTAPTGTKVAEVRLKDNFLYAANRRDLTFNPNDSITAFSLDSAGDMTFQGITSSGGTYPRTFAINKAGDMIVIGDQTTANVVVVKRDTVTGALGPQIASMRIGTVGTAENDNGLSAVIWDE
ncbi:putative 6-phosphogluconolactonase [Lachnellula suecica]|uniref:Putative 6-phosphogluconolactonase n=1 Tax=Lachnellula suecica TaxID=602035 RepID=A0A8T9CLD0_9HELO|nr:putative 6-phosphogluconolactonase [Lachnellula suecica]